MCQPYHSPRHIQSSLACGSECVEREAERMSNNRTVVLPGCISNCLDVSMLSRACGIRLRYATQTVPFRKLVLSCRSGHATKMLVRGQHRSAAPPLCAADTTFSAVKGDLYRKMSREKCKRKCKWRPIGEKTEERRAILFGI